MLCPIIALSGQVTTLHEQVEQLQGHVNDLGDDYARLAAGTRPERPVTMRRDPDPVRDALAMSVGN